MPIMYKLIKWQDLCVEGLVTASVAVSMPLSVDGLVGGNVDDLGLGLLGVVDLLSLGSRSDSSSLDLEFIVAVGAGGSSSATGSRGLGGGSLSRRSGRGAGGSAAGALVSRSLTTAHVEVHVLVGLAGLGLDVIGKDVRDFVAGGRVVARHDRAPGVGGGSLDGTGLSTSDQVVTLLPGGAIAAVGRAVYVGDIEVVVVEAGGVLLDEVLELGDVVALALLSLGNFDGNTDVSALGVGVVLLVSLARLQLDHLIGRAAIALVDRPEVDVVVTAVVNTGQGLAGIALGVQGDCAPGGGSGSHRGRDRKDSNELHFG
jgi:hypothetical protein